MSLVPLALGLLVAGILGFLVLGHRMAGVAWEQRVAGSVVAGVVVIYGLAQGLDLAGVRWSRVSLGTALLIALVSAFWATRCRRPDTLGESASLPHAGGDRLGWGDLVAAVACAGFAARCVLDQALFPDWIYHWGVRAEKAFLEGGLPWEFLSGPLPSHPIYPNLWPTTVAVSAILSGRFDQIGAVCWSVVWLVTALLSIRGAARDLGLVPVDRQVIVASVGLLLAGFGGRSYLAGSADWLPMLSLFLALGPFLVSAGSSAGRQATLGCAAALAAGSKAEGLPLAAAMVGSYLCFAARSGGGWSWARCARVVGPAFFVVLPWVIQIHRHQIGTAAGHGSFELSRVPILLAAAGRVFANGPWLGFGPVLLAAPFALLFVARGRWLGWVGIGYILPIAIAYVSAPFDTAAWVWLSLDRILLQILPLTVAGLFLIAQKRGAESGPELQSIRSSDC